eukprot:Blabericola_migrator_1__12839@NODE_831_length_6355_cov_152_596056_g586_i0_p6_GENE_NODE_831_length_6355_cov_152_596056_g586_i0NODE_831_length_6355_cov_152_596056_g586_i0_p6_ORF_typecomplete_len124_score3_34DUF3995/PF13160_6/0_00062MMPL/PF03176_15/0_019DUF1700/PF08006_11/0_024DUF2207/PF09972_9/0_023DUF4131/PF13567_6/0_042DUF2244/PF10003_9/0_069Wzy_C/PF04932_15/2_1e03Wzy_C/PF04932_15/0_08YfhO/PF09586_10/0_14DUF1129/PF06570_11/0_18DUF3040/PF11239_8/0_57DotU/PF09850_9/0_23DotU/PF09850_9/4e02CD34_anti
MVEYGAGQTSTGFRLAEVWNALRGFAAQPAFNDQNNYVQAPAGGLPDQSPPRQDKPTIATIVIIAIAALVVLWLVRTLMPIILWGGIIVLVVLAILGCFHNAAAQNRSRMYETHPRLGDSHMV